MEDGCRKRNYPRTNLEESDVMKKQRSEVSQVEKATGTQTRAGDTQDLQNSISECTTLNQIHRLGIMPVICAAEQQLHATEGTFCASPSYNHHYMQEVDFVVECWKK